LQLVEMRMGWLCSEKYGLAYVVSKMGLLFVYSVDNLAAVYRQRISADPVFLAQVCDSPCPLIRLDSLAMTHPTNVSRNAIRFA
jgi:hypothetical protein